MSQVTIPPPEIDAPPAGVGKFYEVVNGRVVEPPPMGAFETWIATALTEALAVFFASTQRLGRIAGETLFRLDPDSGLQRRPDLALISYDRWPADRPVPRTAAWDVVPDLVIEVISPGDLAIETRDKIQEYLRAGVRQVWVIYPRSGYVDVYQPPKRVTVLDASDELLGGDLLPGFRLRLSDLFNEQATRPD